MKQFEENQVFQFQLFEGGTYPVSIRVNSYQNNGNIFVGFTTDEDGCTEPFGDVSVNISDLPPYHAALDTNNMPHVAEFVEREELGKPTGERLHSGYCTYPVFEFDRAALQALDPAGCARYEHAMANPIQPDDGSMSMVDAIKEAVGGEVTVIDLNMGM